MYSSRLICFRRSGHDVRQEPRDGVPAPRQLQPLLQLFADHPHRRPCRVRERVHVPHPV